MVGFDSVAITAFVFGLISAASLPLGALASPQVLPPPAPPPAPTRWITRPMLALIVLELLVVVVVLLGGG